MTPTPASATREIERHRSMCTELAERIARRLPEDGSAEQAPGLFFSRSSSPHPVYRLSEPCLCVIAQGGKEILLGDERYRYDGAHYLLVTANLPLTGRTVGVSRDLPYLGLRLVLDPATVTSVLVDVGFPSGRPIRRVRGVAVSRLDADLLDALLRLTRLVDAPSDYEILAPLATREIIYRLSRGEQSGRLRQIGVVGGRAPRIAKAIELVRENFDKPLRIPDLAKELAMSTSGLHHDFKTVTSMSPLQFQKQLRLQEARRMLLDGDVDAATAGFRVGYEDPSYFSRDYKRFFGAPPIRDVERLRAAATNGSDSQT